MKKILFIAPLPPPITGQSIANFELLKFLQTNHDVFVINTSTYTISNCNLNISKLLYVAKFLFKIIFIKKNYDYIYYNNSESIVGNIKDLLIYLILFRHLRKTIVHLHGGHGFTKINNFLLIFINKFFSKYFYRFIVLGKTQYKFFINYLKISPTVIKNFANDNLFVNSNYINTKFSNCESFKIIYVSNMIREKGYFDLLNAFELLDTTYKNFFSLHFAGSFPSAFDENLFLARINNLPNVFYHGQVSGNRKIELFNSSHIFCLPTFYPYEGQPISILEAYASGCFVLTTSHAGIPDIFSDPDNGFFVDVKSPISIANALMKIYDNRDFVKRVAQNNFNSSIDLYTSKRFLDDFNNLLV